MINVNGKSSFLTQIEENKKRGQQALAFKFLLKLHCLRIHFILSQVITISLFGERKLKALEEPWYNYRGNSARI